MRNGLVWWEAKVGFSLFKGESRPLEYATSRSHNFAIFLGELIGQSL